ncbi:MAG: molybdopterin-synthase adenylyltransferase MoeB [Bacteroidota bacterium]
MTALSPDETRRYARHLTLPTVGLAGQERLKQASVLLIGAGGLGSPLALYLVAAGVGRIGIVEFDRVDETNLQRQVLYGSRDADRPKLEAAMERLRDLNPHVDLVPHPVRLTSDNALDLIGGYDVVADGSDNFATRYLVSDACVLTGTPNVYGSVFRFEGQVTVFCTDDGPCYRCLYDRPPPPDLVPDCAEGGVLGVLPGLIGTIQATEVLKLILGIGEPLIGRLLLVDALTMQFRSLAIPKDPDCPACGTHPTITHLIDYEAFCASSATSPMSTSPAVPEVTVRDLKDQIDRGERPFILDVRRPDEFAIANLDGTLIPLDELPNRLEEIEEHREESFVVHCRSGGRSAKAVQMLREAGFEGAVNLKGGVLAWSDEIDPSMPKY